MSNSGNYVHKALRFAPNPSFPLCPEPFLFNLFLFQVVSFQNYKIENICSCFLIKHNNRYNKQKE